ncbi:MAG: transposase, partial [Gammaproteobacteria bacterium]|nr:transposase [Gammaproteobacteria bacterium]
LISLEDTPYHHCISRCVRRAFLWGEDSLTGKNYEHRKAWVVERLAELTKIFAIDICAYAIMSNHHHLVLRIDKNQAMGWNHQEIIERWGGLFSIPQLIRNYQENSRQSRAEVLAAETLIDQWRDRLWDISWFMRALNESLARRANREDGCTGRFWEGRFKSQALLDEAAVLTCMSYVDLNPIRAGMAETPETSEFTSIEQRILQWKQDSTGKVKSPSLMELVKQDEDSHPNAIGFNTQDYLELVDWAGRIVRDGKSGYIPGNIPPILNNLGLEPKGYLHHIKGRRQKAYPLVLGPVHHIRRVAVRLNQCFMKGMGE